MSDKILVLGATGTVGKPTVRALLASGAKVKAASRDGRLVDGAEGVTFDYGKPDTFGSALDGVDRVFVLLPTGSVDPLAVALPFIKAAISRRVKVVFHSVFGVESDATNPYRQIETALEGSGNPFVILRPNWFADNFHTSWKDAIDQGQIAVPAGVGKSSFIDARDIAQTAATVLTSTTFDGDAYNLTGPAALSYAEAAKILSDVIGRPVTYTPVDDACFIDLLTNAGVPEDYAEFLATIYYPVRQGWTEVVTGDVQRVTGRAPYPFQTYARDHAADFVV
jgi:uncharacterized protein YbjT (DUF2867 family)